MNEPSLLRFVWKFTDRETLTRRLERVKARPLPRSGDRFAQLFAWRVPAHPVLLAWTPVDETIELAIAREGQLDAHPLARYLAVRPLSDFWSIAAAWQAYWLSLTRPELSVSPLSLPWNTDRDPVLGSVSRGSNGWMLWDFQLELVAQMAISPQRPPSELPRLLRRGDERARGWLQGAILPHGRSLADGVSVWCYPDGKRTYPFPGNIVSRLMLMQHRAYSAEHQLESGV